MKTSSTMSMKPVSVLYQTAQLEVNFNLTFLKKLFFHLLATLCNFKYAKTSLKIESQLGLDQ